MAISKTLYSLVHQPSFRAKMILKNTFTFTFTGTLSRGFGLRSFRPKLTNLNILIIGKSVFRIRIRIRIRRVGLHSKSPAKKNSSGRNLRRNLRTKTPQAEASGKCATIFFAPQFFLPHNFFCPSPPPPSNKAGWAYRSKLLRDRLYGPLWCQRGIYNGTGHYMPRGI